MKQLKPIVLSLLSLSLINSTDVLAQAAKDYEFYPSSKTYNYITGGAIPKDAYNASLIMPNGDGDENRTILPLGFTFNYCGKDYTKSCLTTNCWASFIEPAYLGTHNEYYDNTSVDNNDVPSISPALMPFFDDMQGINGYTGSNSYKTTGVGRNHVFTFEWKNWAFNGAVKGYSGNSMSLQLKIYEFGAFEFLYKRESGGVPSSATGATIGFTDVNSANYQTLNDATATPTSSTNSFVTNILTMPPTDQSYLWFAKVGTNNAGALDIATPTYPFCVGNENVKVRIMNFGKNRLTSVKVNWELDGVAQTPITYTNLIDTFGSAAGAEAIVTLGNVNFNKPRTIKVYTSDPNGTKDLVGRNDTLIQVLRPAPVAAITATGPTIFCTAGSVNVTLNAPAGTGSSFQWYKNGLMIPGAVNNFYTATLAGDYTLRVDSNGCSNTSGITKVDNLAIPLPLVTPSGNLQMCDSVTMVANAGITGAAYQWQHQGVDIPGATSASYTAKFPGNYTVLTSKLSCTSSSAGISVINVPKPNPKITKNNATLFTDPSFGSYQWQLDGVNIPGATLFAYTPKANGSYTVLVKNGDCTALSDTVVVEGLSVKNINSNQAISIYPNPVKTELFVNAPAGSNVNISSMDGKVLISQPSTPAGINVENIPAGLYIIKVTDAQHAILKTDKLVKTN